MTVNDWLRIIIHIPVGMLAGIPILGTPLRETFHRYEENEDRHIRDQAWKDYRGAMIGEAITAISLIVLVVVLLVVSIT